MAAPLVSFHTQLTAATPSVRLVQPLPPDCAKIRYQAPPRPRLAFPHAPATLNNTTCLRRQSCHAMGLFSRKSVSLDDDCTTRPPRVLRRPSRLQPALTSDAPTSEAEIRDFLAAGKKYFHRVRDTTGGETSVESEPCSSGWDILKSRLAAMAPSPDTVATTLMYAGTAIAGLAAAYGVYTAGSTVLSATYSALTSLCRLPLAIAGLPFTVAKGAVALPLSVAGMATRTAVNTASFSGSVLWSGTKLASRLVASGAKTGLGLG